MIITNRLDTSFGPAGKLSGTIVFIGGILMCFTKLSGLLLVLIGAFVGFTYSATAIDIDKKRIRFINYIFGIIKTGKWLNIDSEMKLGIRKSKSSWRSYSRSNRQMDIEKDDFRIMLFDADEKLLMHVKKFNTIESAEKAIELLASQLGLNRI
ncbi:MAG: hypothetical protein NTZ33_03840 [Bacteroidetes bacterium]|nr:hypothetical protein [Bacteroidota bacterium]